MHNCYHYGNDQIDQTSSNIIYKTKKKQITNVENKTFAWTLSFPMKRLHKFCQNTLKHSKEILSLKAFTNKKYFTFPFAKIRLILLFFNK